MLCVISYELKGSKEENKAFFDTVDNLGNWYRCNESTIFLHTTISAGLVDAAIRGVVGEGTFIVVDVTGKGNSAFYGRVPPRAPDDIFWEWIKKNNN